MDTKEYRLKMIQKKQDLIRSVPRNDTEKAINDLEMLICDVRPYSLSWRLGYIKSIRLAIKALKGDTNGGKKVN